MAEDMEQAVERVREGYEAFNRGDFDGAASWIHPEIEWHRVAEVETRLDGREAVRDNMAPNVFEGQRSEISEVEVIGESILVEARFHAVGRGSGVSLEQGGYHLWGIRDGMAIRFEFFLDRDDAVARARELEAPAAG